MTSRKYDIRISTSFKFHLKPYPVAKHVFNNRTIRSVLKGQFLKHHPQVSPLCNLLINMAVFCTGLHSISLSLSLSLSPWILRSSFVSEHKIS
jgi:hypothetical protein